jgi:aspartate-semialdehyde dehydrogenase
MKSPGQGYSVGVAGASSLLGKELLAVLKERNFPAARLISSEDEEAEPDMPVVDLREGFQPAILDEDFDDADFDVVFVAAPVGPADKKPGAGTKTSFLRSSERLSHAGHSTVIDLGGALEGQPGGAVSVPFLERSGDLSGKSSARDRPRFHISAHPAAIVLSALLLRLAARLALTSAVAEVFVPASEIGPLAVDELQRQTSSLLTFQKIPQAIFGRQLAFNLLPRFGNPKTKDTRLAGIESRLHWELEALLAGSTALPAVRVIQAAVFHSVALSLYVETREPAGVAALEEALKGDRITIARHREPAPSQADSSGSEEILVDAVARDASRPNGAWIWAVADNLRLAATNAAEIAEAALAAAHVPRR